MASSRKRNNSYQIRVSDGCDVNGKSIYRTKSWTPEKGMTEKQIQKELKRQEVLFEEECRSGQIAHSTIKFQEFAEQWFEEHAALTLKTLTIRNYKLASKRIYKAIGHLRIDKITPKHIQKFILDHHAEDSKDKLAPKTIKNHVSFASTVFEYAVKMQVIRDNPCKRVSLPTVQQAEKDVYTLEEAQQMLDLLGQEDEKNLKYVVFFTMALFTGFRRGELLGLEWKDIDFQYGTITVRRTSNWTKEKGTYTDTPKTKTSYRTLKLPDEIIRLLIRYQAWQNKYKGELGDKWIENDRLFTTWNGNPMSTNTPHRFYEDFCKRTGMRYCDIHSMRHLNASMLIFSGIDVKTVQAALGHSLPSTTLNIYSHYFQTTQARAMEAITNCVDFKVVS